MKSSFGRLCALFTFLFAAHTARAVQDVDFSSYNVPLYTQIVNRVRAKISARLVTVQARHETVVDRIAKIHARCDT